MIAEDVQAMNERALNMQEMEERQRMREVAGIEEIGRTTGHGESHRCISWIWYSVGVDGNENDPGMHDSLFLSYILYCATLICSSSSTC